MVLLSRSLVSYTDHDICWLRRCVSVIFPPVTIEL
jgi:hypothetical protein